MDPATILATVFSISKVVYGCSATLYSFAKDVGNQEEYVTSLYSEVEGLQKSLESITKTLQSPSIKRYDQLPLWDDVGDGLGECQKTVMAIHKKLESVRPAPKEKIGKFKTSVIQLKINFSDEEIKNLRAQVHSHSLAMQMILQMINVHISSTSPDVVLNELTPQLQLLVKLVSELHESALPPGVADAGLKRSRTRLEKSAKEVASKASAVVSSRSTIWSGSQIEAPSSKSDATIMDRAAERSITTGSEYGEPLSAETRSRISLWMDQGSRDDSTLPTISEKSPSIFSEPMVRSNDSNTTPLTKDTDDFVAHGDDGDSSDEDEIEIDVARRYMAEGHKRITTDPPQAEAFLRKALTKVESMRTSFLTTESFQVRLGIATACFEQSKLEESKRLCQQLLEETSATEQARDVVLSASHLLSQIYLQASQFEVAVRQCKRTMNGRRRLHGKDDAYFEAVALMALIYQSKGDEIEAMTYAGLLPAEFVTPQFRAANLDMPKDNLPGSDNAKVTEHTSRTSINSMPKDNLPGSDNVKVTEHTGRTSINSEVTVEVLPEDEADELSRSSLSTTRADESSAFPLMTLPPTVKARMDRAKALSASFNVMRKNSAAEITSLDNIQEVREYIRNKRSCMQSSMPVAALDSFEKQGAIQLLEENGFGKSRKPNLDAWFLWAAKEGLTLPLRLLLTDWEYQKPSTLFSQRPGIVKYGPVRLDVVEYVEKERRNALHLAAMHGHAEAVKILLEFGVSRFARTGYFGQGSTPVELAISNEHIHTVKEFIQVGCSDDPPDSKGWSLVHHAASQSNAGFFSLLADIALDVEAQSLDGLTALHIAALRGHSDNLDIILTMPVDVNRRDHQGRTALSLAFSGGHIRCIQQLMKHGADMKTVDGAPKKLLHLAAEHGLVSEIHELVSNGISVNVRDSKGETALNKASKAGRLEVVNVLLSLGAPPNYAGYQNNAPIHHASELNRLDILERLIAAGAMVDQKNNFQKTALILAAIHGHEQIVQRLVAEKVTINIKDCYGSTAYDYAEERGHASITKLLRPQKSRMTFGL